MRELTIKDIEPYPKGKDGLKFKSLITGDDEQIDYIDFKYSHVGIHFDFLEESDDNPVCHKINEIKPYLRGWDQLTKTITHNGEPFIPIGKLHYIECRTATDKKSRGQYEVFEDGDYIGTMPKGTVGRQGVNIYKNNITKTSYKTVLKLVEWHFDINNLLEKGLAVELKEGVEV